MDDGIFVLTFKGSQTIEKSIEVKDTLLKAIKSKKKEILINLSQVGKIDLSFLQLLYSANVEATGKNKKISISGEVPQSILDVIELSGFNRSIGNNPHLLFVNSNKNRG